MSVDSDTTGTMALFLERDQCHKTYTVMAASNSVNLTKLLDC